MEIVAILGSVVFITGEGTWEPDMTATRGTTSRGRCATEDVEVSEHLIGTLRTATSEDRPSDDPGGLSSPPACAIHAVHSTQFASTNSFDAAAHNAVMVDTGSARHISRTELARRSRHFEDQVQGP